MKAAKRASFGGLERGSSKENIENRPGDGAGGGALRVKEEEEEVTRLLQDASLMHKKIDALVESDQQGGGESRRQNLEASDPEIQFVDRLYQSIAKLKHLERSRNKMALCAESMEVSRRERRGNEGTLCKGETLPY